MRPHNARLVICHGKGLCRPPILPRRQGSRTDQHRSEILTPTLATLRALVLGEAPIINKCDPLGQAQTRAHLCFHGGGHQRPAIVTSSREELGKTRDKISPLTLDIKVNKHYSIGSALLNSESSPHKGANNSTRRSPLPLPEKEKGGHT